MRKEMQRLGMEKAVNLLRECRTRDTDTCEECGAIGTVWDFGCAYYCGECLVGSVKYWETRGGFSSEMVFANFPHMPAESSLVYSVAMESFFSTLYGDTCEECGAFMSSTNSGWIHENTPTVGECFTAYRWGVK
jgi:hypothetical protein